MILDLVREGRRVGVTAQSHKVIANMLEAVVDAVAEEAREVRIAQRCDSGRGQRRPAHPRASRTMPRGLGLPRAPTRSSAAPHGSGLATTWNRRSTSCSSTRRARWRWRPCAPRQARPTRSCSSAIRTSFPRSPRAPIPRAPRRRRSSISSARRRRSSRTRGLLLSTTYRLHPDVNAFISDTFYEGRLEPATGNERQSIAAGEPVGGVGIRQVELATKGAANRSRDEAEWIAQAIERLLGRRWTDRDGRMRPLDHRRRARRGAVQRAGRRDRGDGRVRVSGCAPTSAPSTASRAARRRSPSTR